MYLSFYNLKRKPFQISSDPSFMWFGEKHREALATLKYGILDNKGFLLMTGDVGTGKTTLINSLLQSLSDDVLSAFVPDPGLEKMDFFSFIASGFGMESVFQTKGAFLAHFRHFLLDARQNGKKVLLIIDEAQLLSQQLLEEIRLLSNIETPDAKLINIFFVGQNEFNAILNREENRAVRQRLTLNYHIEPLTPDEIGEYIRYRMAVAGASYPVFSEEGVQAVFMASGGFPRRINVICDHCLLSGYVKEQKVIGGAIVAECAEELKIRTYGNRDLSDLTAAGREKAADRPRPANAKRPGGLPGPAPDAGKKNRHGSIPGFLFLGAAVFALTLYYFSVQGSNAIPLLKNRIQMMALPWISELMREEPAKEPVKAPEVREKITHEPLPSMPLAFEDFEKPILSESTDTRAEAGQEKILSPPPQSADRQEESPPPAPPLPTENLIVRFDYNTNDLTEDDLKHLTRFADILRMHPEAEIKITGYTDSEGNENYNQKLSEFRANIVKSFFMGHGLRSEQIKALGLGSRNPLDSNETLAGRMVNRRVEVEVINRI